MKNLKANELQSRIIDSKARVTIVAVGCGAGSSVGLYMKALSSKKSTAILYNSHRRAQRSMDEFINKFEQFVCNVNRRQNLVILVDGRTVIFAHPDTPRLNNHMLLLIDDVHTYPSKRSLQDILRFSKEVVCTSKPYECGWRNPLYKNGELERDENGAILYTERSWDHSLVNWGKECELGFVGNKARPTDYKRDVEVIHGYDFEENTHLINSYPEYKESLDNLPPKLKQSLSKGSLLGGWW